jgi:choline transport protein
MTLSVICGVIALVATMAEMTSMAPTSGGQYHWVSEFAPPHIQKPLSYMVGWMSALGWVTGCPATAQLTGSLIQGLVYLKNPNADFGALWQFALLVMLILLLSCGFNIFGTQILPTAEGIFLIVHVLGYFAFLIVFWVMSDHSPAKEVFTTFADEGNWGSNGLATLVGITTPLWSFLGPDAGSHMSEEMKDAGSVLPSAMLWATLGNCAFGFTMLITFCFCAGDIDTLLNSSSGIPVIQVTYTATNSFAATTILTLILILISFVSSITCVATSSRQIWAFARDGGFPFSSWIDHVNFRAHIPLNFY